MQYVMDITHKDIHVVNKFLASNKAASVADIINVESVWNDTDFPDGPNFTDHHCHFRKYENHRYAIFNVPDYFHETEQTDKTA